MTLARPENLRVDLPLEQMAQLCRKWGIVRLELFGSALREDFNDSSDVDLLYTFGRGVRIGLDLVTIHNEFESLLGRPVDLVSRPAVERSRNPFRRREILDGSRVVYAQ